MAEVGQRKTVTVLFSDLVESTALAEQLDAEALAELLSGYFAQMRSIVELHGGTVEKFIGDAVVGMFGVPTTHEDDALRAVRAALDMQAAIEEMNVRAGNGNPPSLAARIGINTGEVAVAPGTNGNDGHLALGHAINMAARLEQAAEAGEILIGPRTKELAADAVSAEPMPPLAVKGSSAPVLAWKVIEANEGRRRGWEGQGAFVGREKELAVIEMAFNTARDERAFVVVTVVAPPGMGKSRLASEATRRLGGQAQVLVGSCLPYGEGVTYAPLVEMAVSAGASHSDETVERARRALAETALASPEETAWAFKQLLESVAERQPVLAVVDDLHWAEPLLLDALDYVATLSTDRPILLLCLTRPDLLDTRPEWAAPRQHSAVTRLEPLTADETDALLSTNEALAADADQRREIVDAAAGVPLFVEQIAALRLEGEGGIPQTVRALLAARVDRLRPGERAVLERAAIQGEAFDRATVAALLDDAAAGLGGTLMGLVRREFVRPERSADGVERFRFSHALLRDAVYEQMPRRMRSDLHERYANAVASANGDPEIVGHHLERAHAERAIVAASNPETAALGIRAGGTLHAAGKRALARKEWRHASHLLQRARALLSGQPGRVADVLVDLMVAHGESAEWASAAQVHAEAVQTARAAGDVSAEVRAEMGWVNLETRRGNTEIQQQIPALAERAVEYFGRSGSDADMARALLLKAFMPTSTTIADSIELLRQAAVHADRAGDERTQIEIWDELGGAMIFGPTPYEEIGNFAEREISWARERGIAFTEADGLLAMAYVVAASGDTNRAREAVADVRQLFAQLPGFVPQLAESDTLGATIELEAGDPSRAEALFRRALETLEKGEHALWWRAASLGLAEVLVELDRHSDARQLVDEIDRRGLTWGPRPKSRYLQVRARLARAVGEIELAVSLARDAVNELANVGSHQNEARARELLGDLLGEAGDAAAAAAEWRRARELYAAKGYVPGERRMAQKLSPAS